MHIFWMVVGGVAVLLFMIFNLIVTLYMLRQYRGEENRPMPGKRIYYVVTSSILIFIFLTSFYSAITIYVGGPNKFGLWLIISIPLSLSGGLFTYLNRFSELLWGLATKANNT